MSVSGGSLLGQGLYGCAFTPPLKCKTKIVSKGKRVGKLTTSEEAAKESNVSSILKHIPSGSKYFILIDSECEPAPRENQTEQDLQKCEFIEGKPLGTVKQLQMPLGGLTLQQTPKRATSIEYFAMGQHLLEAGALLLTKHIVHSDLHKNNILVDSRTQCRLIDFGIAWRPDELSLSNLYLALRSFEPSITQEPPECTFVNGMYANLRYDEILEGIEHEKTILKKVSLVTGTPMYVMMRELRNFVSHSWSVKEQNWYVFYKLYWSKFDAWAIGVCLLSLLAEMLYDPSFESATETQQRLQSTTSILKGLCQIDPGKRLDCAEALQLWAPNSSVLEEKAVKDWLQGAAKERASLEKIL
jgi:serine/threonine protein kinase